MTNTTVHYNRAGDYAEWIREVENIEDSTDEDALRDDDIIPDIIDDEQEQAARFLKDVGFNALSQNCDENSEFFSILTKKQKQTISQRIDTVRQKTRFQHTDVRSIFPQAPLPEEPSHSVDGSIHSSQSKPLTIPPEKEEFYIPPPDYHNIRESIIHLGTEMVHPNSDLIYEGRNRAASTGEKNSSSPTALVDQSLGRDEGVATTRISDLGKKDLKMLKYVCIVELHTVFDEYKLTYMRHKSKKKAKDHSVYGVPLQTLLDRDRKNFSAECNVPMFFQQLIQHLEKKGLSEEGIFRIPGGIVRMREIRQEIDSRWPRGRFVFDEVMIHDAAGLLKQFLRDLPDSLLTVEMMDAYLKILDVPDEKKRLYLLNLLIVTLPDVNRCTLKLLLSFLKKVIDNPDNRMTLTSVAMIVAPNLFFAKTNRGPRAKAENIEVELQMAERTSRVVMIMIEHQDSIWTIPSNLLVQIRQKNETRRTRFNIPVIGKKDRSETYRTTQIGEGISNAKIQVSLENSSGETSVPITEATTSSDVISFMHINRSPNLTKKQLKSAQNAKAEGDSRKSDNSLSPSSCENSVLFEVGGNIGERRLDGLANILSVIQINPNAKFVVRQKPV